MSMQNLAIVFGPTLFGQIAAANGQANGGGMADAPYQNQVRPRVKSANNNSLIWLLNLGH